MPSGESAADLVGRTSSRLLAAGVSRPDRLAALKLLAVLDASTDAEGRVRRPLDDLAGEFDLAPLEAMRSLELLANVDAIAVEGGSVVLLGRTAEGLGGLQLADFLDDVRASFEAPVPLAARRGRSLARAGVGLVAAAAVAAVAVLAIAPPAPSPADRARVAAPAAAPGAGERPSSGTATVPSPDVRDAGGGAAEAAAPPAAETPATVVAADAAACDTTVPLAAVVDGKLRVTNATGQPLVVTEIVVNGRPVSVSIDVPARGTATQELAAVLGTVDVTVDRWHCTA